MSKQAAISVQKLRQKNNDKITNIEAAIYNER